MRYLRNVFPIIFFLFLTIVLTYPITFKLNTLHDKPEGDIALCLWNLWWVNKSIGEFHTTPFHTDYIFHPTGVDLSFHSFSFYNTLLSIPIVPYVGLIPTYNLLLIMTFLLAGLGAFYLARDQGLGVKAALIAGVIYGFGPYHFGEFSRLDSTSIQWIPFACLFILRLYKNGKPLDAILGGIFLVLVSLCSWYYMIFIILLYSGILLYYLLFRSRELLWIKFIKNSIILFGLFFVLISPLAFPLIKSVITSTHGLSTGPVIFRADLLGITRGMHFNREFIAWPAVFGYITSALCIYSVCKIKWKDKRLWIFLGLCFFILALGPRLLIGGKITPYIRLPEAIFYHLPVLNNIRAPYRLLVISILASSLIAAHGSEGIFKIIKRRFNYSISFLFIVFIFILFIAEVWMVPISRSEVTIPEFYSKISKIDDEFAIFEVPRSSSTWSSAMFYQTFHSKKLVGGYTGFKNPEFEFIESSPVLTSLSMMLSNPLNKGEILSTLKSFDIRYVIVQLKHWAMLSLKHTVNVQSLETTPSPLWPASFRRLRLNDLDVLPENILEKFRLSKESRNFISIFGPPIFEDSEMVVFKIINQS